MTRPRKSARRRPKKPQPPGRSDKVSRQEPAGRGDGTTPSRWSAWFRVKHPILRFVIFFGVYMGALYAFTMTAFFERHGWVPYLDLNADVSGALLGFFGQDVTVAGRAINAPGASLLIERGCDAIHPSALFMSAVLAAPTSIRSRLLGAIVGISLLMVTNLIRIISLFYVRKHWPEIFEMMHVEVWQALFIFLAILLWVIWARWAVRSRAVQVDATT